ncbi:MAG: PEP-CTERM sorting domain-containing protein [Terriglobia bacterium]
MKRYRALLVVLALLCMSAVASATADIRIIFDPGVPASTFENLYVIANPNTQYTVNWLDCKAYPNPPFNPPPSSNGFDACLGFFNSTGSDLSTFNLSFTVPLTGPGSDLIGQPINCGSAAGNNNLTNNNCPSGNMSALQDVDVTFFGGTPVSPNQAFFIGETGVDCSASSNLECTTLPQFTVIDPAPEPSLLLLLGAGLLICSLGFAYRRLRLA